MSMYVWRKSVPVGDAELWEERMFSLGQTNVVLVTEVKRKTADIEVFSADDNGLPELQALEKDWGGKVLELKDQDWVAASSDPGEPIFIRDRIVLTGHDAAGKIAELEAKYPRRDVLTIPPRMAFGTGSHATTATCLRMLVDLAAAKLKGRADWSMCDVGCGSGILALAAKRLGAGKVVGTDFDPQAVAISEENLVSNGTSGIEFKVSDLLVDGVDGEWDVVVANVFSDVLIAAAPALVGAVAKDGSLIVSGILAAQADGVVTALKKAGAEVEDLRKRGRWVTILLRLA